MLIGTRAITGDTQQIGYVLIMYQYVDEAGRRKVKFSRNGMMFGADQQIECHGLADIVTKDTTVADFAVCLPLIIFSDRGQLNSRYCGTNDTANPRRWHTSALGCLTNSRTT